jgi:hypothetical protein
MIYLKMILMHCSRSNDVSTSVVGATKFHVRKKEISKIFFFIGIHLHGFGFYLGFFVLYFDDNHMVWCICLLGKRTWKKKVVLFSVKYINDKN